MTRNNKILIATLLIFFAALTAIKVVQLAQSRGGALPIVLYEIVANPYCNVVGEGARAFARDSGAKVRVVTGQEGTQANVNSNIESLFTQGYQAFSIYPFDPAGSKGMFQRLKQGGRIAVAYGAQPAPGTAAPFVVATDTRAAARLETQTLIELMGGHGRILNVLETMTDANTAVRKAAIEAEVGRHPGVSILQTIGDMTSEQKAREKIESVLVARGEQIDGIICTGSGTTAAAASILSDHNRQTGAHFIHFVGLDVDQRVLEAIRSGWVDATLAQNSYGHGYISCAILDLMQQGWKPTQEFRFIDTGCVVVRRDNVDQFQRGLDERTAELLKTIRRDYLRPPSS